MERVARRTVIALAFAGVLAACGFTPVYGPGGGAEGLFGKIAVAEPTDQDTYQLVQELEQRLGRASVPEFDLSLYLKTDSEGQAVTASGDITRYSISGTVEYVLTARETDAVVNKGVVRNFTGYSATGSTVETLASERDARRRLMGILAEQITTQIYSLAEVPG